MKNKHEQNQAELNEQAAAVDGLTPEEEAQAAAAPAEEAAAAEPEEVAAEPEEATEELPPEEALARLAAAYAALEKEKQALAEDKQALEQQMARLQADFDNFRRRTRTEKEDWQRNITASLCAELLPVVDNFGRAVLALRNSEMDEKHIAGVEMIARQLLELLAGKGVERIATVGEDFDPNWHEAVGQTPVEDESQVGKVTEELQPGYRLGQKLLRVAMVHVGSRS